MAVRAPQKPPAGAEPPPPPPPPPPSPPPANETTTRGARPGECSGSSRPIECASRRRKPKEKTLEEMGLLELLRVIAKEVRQTRGMLSRVLGSHGPAGEAESGETAVNGSQNDAH